MARRALIYILYLGGITALLIVAEHIVMGTASIPGAGPASATLDSEDRFYAVIFGGYGIALVHAARDVDARSSLIRFLAGLFLLGAFARILSWVLVGPPHPFFKAMLGLEFVLPLIIFGLQTAIARSKNA